MDTLVAPALAERMRVVAAELSLVGMAPSPRVFAGFLPAGNHETFAVETPAGACVVFVALATRNVTDVDAALYTPDGALLAVDSEPDAHPTIEVCTKTPRRLYYVIQLFDGDGSFVVVPFVGSRAALVKVGKVLGGRPALVDAALLEGGDEDPRAVLAEGLRKRGFAAVGEPLSFAVALAESVRTPLRVEPGVCYTVAAFGSAGISRLALRVLDPQGATRGEDAQRSPRAALQWCANDAGNYAIETRASSGAGDVTLLVFRADVVVVGGEAGLWLRRP